MIATNIRDLIQDWEERGILLRIKKEVDPKYELGAVIHSRKGRQPFLFEKVWGYDAPMVAGLGGDRDLMADSLGIRTSDLTDKIMQSIVNPIPTREVATGPVHDNVVMEPTELDDIFAIPTYNEKDGGQYIVCGVLVVKDPEGGPNRYTSIRRLWHMGGNRAAVVITSQELFNQFLQFEKEDRPLEVAVMLGVVPAIILSSQIPTHLYHVDKLNVAGALLGRTLETVKCKTVDVDVLAEAEIVLEGKILPNVRVDEGPFGEVGGYYGEILPQPVIEFTAVTYRNGFINQALFPGNNEEKLPTSLIKEATLFSTVRQSVPNVKAVHITMGGTGRLHGIIQIDKQSEGDGKQAALAAFASDRDLKHVVVVNDDVDIFDLEDVEWAIATRCQADRDVFIVPGAKGTPLEASHNLRGVSAKMGIDATYPLNAAQKFERPAIPFTIKDLRDYL
mgnify:FL=1